MPILSPSSDPRLAELGFEETPSGLAVRSELSVQIPSWEQMKEQIGSSEIQRQERRSFELSYQRALMNANNLGARTIVGATLSTVGIPEDLISYNPKQFGENILDGALSLIDMNDNQLGVLAGFDQEMGTILDAGLSTVGELIEAKAVDLLGPALDAAMNLVAAVPIVGWVVRVGYAFGKAIAGLIRSSNARAPSQAEFKDEWAGYSPSIDIGRVNNRIYPMLASSPYDLTPIFSPPGHWQRVTTYAQTGYGFKFTKLKEPKGWRVMSRSRVDMLEKGWLGVMPGANKIHAGIEASADGSVVTDYGAMFPATAQQVATLWGQIVQPSVSMYSINPDILRERWMLYWWSLRKAIVEFVLQGDNPGAQDRPPESWAKAVINFLAEPGQLGWKPYLGKDGERVVSLDDEDVWGISDCTMFRALDALGTDQYRFARTNLCAYVSIQQSAFKTYDTLDNAPLRTDTARWDRVRSARMFLMGNAYQNARCLIDLDNINDEAFRANLEQATQTCPPRQTLLNVEPFRKDIVPYSPPPTPPIQHIQMGSVKPPTSGGGSGGGAALAMLGLVGVAGLGTVLTRRNRR